MSAGIERERVATHKTCPHASTGISEPFPKTIVPYTVAGRKNAVVVSFSRLLSPLSQSTKRNVRLQVESGLPFVPLHTGLHPLRRLQSARNLFAASHCHTQIAAELRPIRQGVRSKRHNLHHNFIWKYFRYNIIPLITYQILHLSPIHVNSQIYWS